MGRLRSMAVAACVLCVASSAAAGVIHVPADQPTIQAGVNAAASGDTVIVAPGIYAETVLIYRDGVTLRSASGPTVTVVDAAGFSQGFLVYGSVSESTILRGFTVLGGVSAGVTCMGGTAATIEDMVLMQNQGPGIFSASAAPTIKDCEFKLNDGYGMRVEGGTPLLVECEFLGEGLEVVSGAHPELQGCTFSGSAAALGRPDSGCGLRVSGASMTVDGCTFTDYYAYGAIELYSTGPISIANSEFLRNACQLGPAIFCEGVDLADTPLTVTDTLFEDNAGWENGGAIVLRWSEGAWFEGCTFRSNISSGLGGAVSTHDIVTASYSHCEFIDNFAGSDGGAVRAYGPTSSRELLIDHCLFVDNRCNQEGGSIRPTNCYGSITNCTIHGGDSTAESGAIYVSGDTAPSIESCIISHGTGYGISAGSTTSTPVVLFCDVYEMSSGLYEAPVPDMTGYYGNISVDPLFCDAFAGDFHLHDLSPCATAGPSGEYIGAYGVGCSGTTVEERSWGSIKAMYR